MLQAGAKPDVIEDLDVSEQYMIDCGYNGK
jgi:hypothetical protein